MQMPKAALTLASVLGALALCFASEALHVASVDVVAFTADPVSPDNSDAHFKDFQITRSSLMTILDSYHEVPSDVWAHRYSHVAGGDRTGTITLRDGRIIKWLARPAGLATLIFPDGGKVYLARERPSI
jgi:hypothetical protein